MYAGKLKFFTFVFLSQNGGPIYKKRVSLATVYCEYADINKKLIEFQEANDHIREKIIYARFEYTETVCSDYWTETIS